jgi:hypothetical protein
VAAVPAPSPIAAQPPPPLPSDPSIGNVLSNYLQQFSLWCRNGFAAKLSGNVALPGVILQANDTPAGAIPAVFMIQVKTDGTIVATPMPLGSGKP